MGRADLLRFSRSHCLLSVGIGPPSLEPISSDRQNQPYDTPGLSTGLPFVFSPERTRSIRSFFPLWKTFVPESRLHCRHRYPCYLAPTSKLLPTKIGCKAKLQNPASERMTCLGRLAESPEGKILQRAKRVAALWARRYTWSMKLIGQIQMSPFPRFTHDRPCDVSEESDLHTLAAIEHSPGASSGHHCIMDSRRHHFRHTSTTKSLHRHQRFSLTFHAVYLPQ